VDDEVCLGKPSFKNRKVLVNNVIGLLVAGVAIDEM